MKYTLEQLKQIASKYQHRVDFAKNDRSAYDYCRRYKIHEEVCSHMVPKRSAQKRALYVFEFEDKTAYVGLTYDYDRRYNHHMSVTSKITEKMKTVKVNYIKLNEWFDQEIAKTKETELIQKYKNEGWVLLNSNRGGSLGGSHLRWTINKIKQEALKYTSRSDFSKYSKGAYARACDLEIMDEVCQHMGIGNKKKWSKEKLLDEAKKYKSRSEFRKNNAGAYCMAWYLGILQEACLHMPKVSRNPYKGLAVLRSDGVTFINANKTGLNPSSVRNAIKNNKQYKGYYWSFLKEENEK